MNHDQFLEYHYTAQAVKESIREAAVQDEADYLVYSWREHTHAMESAVHDEVLADDIADLIFVAANQMAKPDQDVAMRVIGLFVVDLLQKEALRVASYNVKELS